MRRWSWILIIGVVVIVAASVLTVTVLIPHIRYNHAITALNEGKYEEAIATFAALGDYRDSAEKLKESRYDAAEVKLDEGLYEQAMQEFSELASYRDSSERYREARYRWGIALTDEGKYRDALELFLSDMEYAGVKDEIGRMYKLAAQNGEKGVAYDAAVSLRDFKGITDLNLQVIAAGRDHVVALCRDGRVVAAGNNDEGQCNVEDWTDIVAVAAGFKYTVGLRADGTVVATGFNNNGQCNVQDWTDIVEIYVGNTATETVGVKADGTIVATGALEGKDYLKQIPGKAEGMLKVCPGFDAILVLMEGGNIRYMNKSFDEMDGIENFMGVIDVAIGTVHAVGVRFDGTVVAAGRSTAGQKDVEDWTHIIAIAASNSNTAGLKTDGTVVVAGDDKKGQKDANMWEDIAAVSVGPGFIVGLKTDGTVVVAGAVMGGTNPDIVEKNRKALEEIATWRNIGPAS